MIVTETREANLFEMSHSINFRVDVAMKKKFALNLFGPLFAVTNKKTVHYVLSESNPTIEDLLAALFREYPDLHDIVFDGDKLAEYMTIVVNGTILGGNEWKSTQISPADRISLFKGESGG